MTTQSRNTQQDRFIEKADTLASLLQQPPQIANQTLFQFPGMYFQQITHNEKMKLIYKVELFENLPVQNISHSVLEYIFQICLSSSNPDYKTIYVIFKQNHRGYAVRRQNTIKSPDRFQRFNKYFMKQVLKQEVQVQMKAQERLEFIERLKLENPQPTAGLTLKKLEEQGLAAKSETTGQQQQNQSLTVLIDPSDLKWRFHDTMYNLVRRRRKRRKGTNIPKFILNIFRKNLPRLEHSHRLRVESFFRHLKYSKTRFDLVRLFGEDPRNELWDAQNAIHRGILGRILNKNYENVLNNRNILQENKRLYLMFCKKIMLRLYHPQVIDKMEV